MKAQKLALLAVATAALTACSSSNTQTAMSSMDESHYLCAQKYGTSGPGYDRCFRNMMTAHGYCSAGSGMDAVVSVQNGTAKCQDDGAPYAAARNNAAGYSTSWSATPR